MIVINSPAHFVVELHRLQALLSNKKWDDAYACMEGMYDYAGRSFSDARKPLPDISDRKIFISLGNGGQYAYSFLSIWEAGEYIGYKILRFDALEQRDEGYMHRA